MVTNLGIECYSSGSVGYWIPTRDLNAKTGEHSEVLLHLARKEWVDLDELLAAWCTAVVASGTKLHFDVTESIQKARKLHDCALAYRDQVQ